MLGSTGPGVEFPWKSIDIIPSIERIGSNDSLVFHLALVFSEHVSCTLVLYPGSQEVAELSNGRR